MVYVRLTRKSSKMVCFSSFAGLMLHEYIDSILHILLFWNQSISKSTHFSHWQLHPYHEAIFELSEMWKYTSGKCNHNFIEKGLHILTKYDKCTTIE